jgi:hypothetical protein
MRIFLMKYFEHAKNFRTFQKLVRKQYRESHAQNCSFRDEKCALEGNRKQLLLPEIK